MRIGFVTYEWYAGGRIRSFYPAAALRESGYRVTYEDVDYPEDPKVVDIMVVHRPIDAHACWNIERLRKAGTKVIVQEDDHLEAVPDSLNEVKTRLSPAMLQTHREAIAMADGLFVTTDSLLRIYGPLAKKVWLVPNYIPRRFQASAWINLEGVPRVGWMGRVGVHTHDLKWIAPLADRMLQGARFSTVGDEETPRFIDVWGSEVWGMQLDDYRLYHIMSRADIGIVPLAPIAMNISKSNLKAMEYMVLGKPVVVSRYPEQEKLVVHGHNGFLADSPEEFAEYVQTLVQDPTLRHEMSVAARETVQHLGLEDMVEAVWGSSLMEAMG